MPKYKLAFLISHPIQYQTPLFRKLSQEKDIELTVLYCIDYGVKELTDPGFGVSFKWDIPSLEGYSYKFLENYSFCPQKPSSFFWLINPSIISELKKTRYDAVIIHGYNYCTNWFGYFGAWLTKTPVIFRGETVIRINRSSIIKFLKWFLLTPLFKGTAAFLTIGTRSRDFYLHYGVPEKKLFFTPYAVNNDFFMKANDQFSVKKESLKKELGFKNNQKIILFVGKLIEKKRPFDLINAYQQLLDKIMVSDEVGLVFVGDGELRPALEAYVQQHQLEWVRFVGFKNQTELPRYYALADIFVLPSSGEEVSPLVVNEAMCSRLPIVISDAVPSAVDFVESGLNGFLFPFGNIEKLTEVLERSFSNKFELSKMGEESFKFISDWNYDVCIGGILKALKFVTKK